MVPKNEFCTCSGNSDLFSPLKHLLFSIAFFGSFGLAYYFWDKKKRLALQLHKIQENSKNLKFNCNHDKKQLIYDKEKRLENAIESVTCGMKITNKRLIQLSNQVHCLRKRLEEFATQLNRQHKRGQINDQ